MTYQIGQNCIIREADGANIPLDPTNTDYQNYLQWEAEGNTADPAAPVQMSQAQSIQSSIVSLACQEAISIGFTSSALGTVYSYGSDDTDQRNLLSALSASSSAVSGWTTPLWCATGGVWALVSHTAAQLQQVNADWITFRVNAQQKYAALIVKINAAKSVAAVRAIAWV